MNIALFGGAFDPPHKGHLAVAQAILDEQLADEVWFIPVKNHAFDKDLTPASHRVAMLQSVLLPKMKIEDYELKKSGVSYTYDTFTKLISLYPHHRFSWVIGSDNLPSFHKWKNASELGTEFDFWVYPREGYPFSPMYPSMKPLTNLPLVTVSSTTVRNLVKRHQPIVGLVEPAVAQYIISHNLYNED